MTFMIVEHIRDVTAVGQRFRERGRMVPEGVEYVASCVADGGCLCYQVMEAPSVDKLQVWMDGWRDLVDFEVVPVQGSAEFWAKLSTSS